MKTMKKDPISIQKGINAMKDGDWKIAIAKYEKAALEEGPSEDLLTNLRECRNLAAIQFSRKLSNKYKTSFIVRFAEVVELAKAGRNDIAISLCGELLDLFRNCSQCQIKLRWKRIVCEVEYGQKFEYLDEDFVFLWVAFGRKEDYVRMQSILVRYIMTINTPEAINPLKNIINNRNIKSESLKSLILAKIEELSRAQILSSPRF